MGFCHVFFVQWTKQLNHCTSFFSFPTGFVYAPNFLRAAASAKDPVRRFELVMAFAVAGLHFGAKPTRPFEPLLGETLQAALYDGSQIYCEQISSTPLISAFELLSPGKSKANNMKPLNAWLGGGAGDGGEGEGEGGGGEGGGGGGGQKEGGVNRENVLVSDSSSSEGEDMEEEEDQGHGHNMDDGEDTEDEEDDMFERMNGGSNAANAVSMEEDSKENSWTLTGQFEHGTDFKGNTFIMSTKGEARVSFHDGYIDYTLPQISLNGILVGDRVTEIIGEMKFVDVANGLECVLRFDANKKTGIDGLLQGKTASDQFRGTCEWCSFFFFFCVTNVWSLVDLFNLSSFVSCFYIIAGTIVEKVLTGDGKVTERNLGVVEGSWFDGLSCEGRTVWDMHVDRPSLLLFDNKSLLGDVLPSDSRYRSDIIAMISGEDETSVAEETRNMMEKEHRDIRLRETRDKKR